MMNNKAFYAILGFVALSALLPLDISWYMPIRILLCGGAFYYVYHEVRKRRQLTLMIFLMALTGVVFNPIIPIHLGTKAGWVPLDILTAVLFWIASKETTLKEKE